jgi:hypothetical protein
MGQSRHCMQPCIAPSMDECMIHPSQRPKQSPRVQPFLRKIFEGINSLEFDGQGAVVAMISEEGERVQLDK